MKTLFPPNRESKGLIATEKVHVLLYRFMLFYRYYLYIRGTDIISIVICPSLGIQALLRSLRVTGIPCMALVTSQVRS